MWPDVFWPSVFWPDVFWPDNDSEDVILYPVASKTGPAIYEPMIGRPLRS